MTPGNGTEREAQVVHQTQHSRETEGPIAEAEPQEEQDDCPTREDGIGRAGVRLGCELRVKFLQALRQRSGAEVHLRLLENRLEFPTIFGRVKCRTRDLERHVLVSALVALIFAAEVERLL